MVSCFKDARNFRAPYFIILVMQITLLYFVYSGPSTWSVPSPTLQLLPLKVLDFGLQKTTVPSSGAVASIHLVSPSIGLQRNEFV